MDILQRTLDGWLDGSAYALVGIGLALTFGTLRRLNLAYGAGAMLAAYAGSWLFTRYDAPAWVVAPSCRLSRPVAKQRRSTYSPISAASPTTNGATSQAGAS